MQEKKNYTLNYDSFLKNLFSNNNNKTQIISHPMNAFQNSKINNTQVIATKKNKINKESQILDKNKYKNYFDKNKYQTYLYPKNLREEFEPITTDDNDNNEPYKNNTMVQNIYINSDELEKIENNKKINKSKIYKKDHMDKYKTIEINNNRFNDFYNEINQKSQNNQKTQIIPKKNNYIDSFEKKKNRSKEKYNKNNKVESNYIKKGNTVVIKNYDYIRNINFDSKKYETQVKTKSKMNIEKDDYYPKEEKKSPYSCIPRIEEPYTDISYNIYGKR